MTPAADRQGLAASRIQRAQANPLNARDAVAHRNADRTPRESCRAVRPDPGTAGNVASAAQPLDETRAHRIRHRLSPPVAAIEPPHDAGGTGCPPLSPTTTSKTRIIGWPRPSVKREVFGPLGVTNIRTFVDPQDPTGVALLMDVADMDVVMGAMDSEGIREAMTHDGVVADSLVILVEA
jgi:hypothetical protein